MLFSEALGEFVADLKLAGRAGRTIEGHQLELLRLERWLDDQQLDWAIITRQQLRPYTRLRAELGHSSRSNMYCTLRSFYRWAVESGYVALSPAAGFKTPARPRPLPRALTLQQVRGLVEHLQVAAGRPARRDEALLLTALYSGLRSKELAGLRWSHIDFDAGVIWIRISKMNHGRAVPLHPVLKEQLRNWGTIQAPSSDWPIFSLDGEALAAARPGKISSRVAKASGVPFTTHILRHTFATWMLRNSGNIYAVSKSLGHSQVRQTEIYVSADVADLRSALETLPAIGQW